MKTSLFIATAALLISASPTLAQRSTAETFTWQGRLNSGATLQIRNVNGPVTLERSSGNDAEVIARKRWNRGDPTRVAVEAVRYGTGDQSVVVCAMWNVASRCTEDGVRDTPRGSNDDNDVSVEFTVRLPAGVNATLHTVNGPIEVTGATATVRASTVNGDVRVNSSGGPVDANTVNGSVDATLGTIGAGDDLQFKTVNGSITVNVPPNASADIEASTVLGSINTDFPLTVSGSLTSRRISGSVGGGGRRIVISTVTGSISLRKN